jgi:hypothetical protein
MRKIKQRRLKELQRLEYKLKSKFNQNQFFKRLYEKANKDNEKNDKESNCVIITNSEGRNIFSDVPEDIIAFLNNIGHFDNEMFDPENNTISMKNYFEILQTVKYLIDILQFDLTKAFVDSDRFKLLDDLKS